MQAANDRASAYAQWLQLHDVERKPGDGLDAPLVVLLNQIATRRNANYLQASRLAARLGLPRVHAADNQTGDNIKFDTSLAQMQGVDIVDVARLLK